MPLKREVRRLGSRWPMIVERALLVAKTIPPEGVSLAAFESAALLEAPLSDVKHIVEALQGKGVIWARKNRGEIRVFRSRPEKIAGIIGAPEPEEAFLAASVPHVYRLAGSLRRREQAKLTRDHAAAQEARTRVAVCCQRVVGIAKSHMVRGLTLAKLRTAMWDVFPRDAMQALSQFEVAFSENAVDLALAEDEASRMAQRIAAKLPLPDKIAALVEKAGATGITKTALYQAIRPKPCSTQLGIILDRLGSEERVVARRVRVPGTQREGLRYFHPAVAGRGAQLTKGGVREGAPWAGGGVPL